MSDSFTPGPWHHEANVTITVRTENGGIIADCVANWTPRDADRLANARLIAAAPVLLEALRWILDKGNAHEWLPVKGRELASAALAAAEGVQAEA